MLIIFCDQLVISWPIRYFAVPQSILYMYIYITLIRGGKKHTDYTTRLKVSLTTGSLCSLRLVKSVFEDW